MDQVDWRILDELQGDARLSFNELSRRVNLSAPSVAERVRKMEAVGVITGYHCQVDPAAAGRPVTVASLLGEDKPETRIWRRITETLARTAPGRFDLRIVPNAALGGEKEVAEGLRLGSIQAALSTISTLSAWVPQGQILDLPFLFRDRDHLRRVLAGPLGTELRAQYEAQGFVVLGFINYGARHLHRRPAPASPSGCRSA